MKKNFLILLMLILLFGCNNNDAIKKNSGTDEIIYNPDDSILDEATNYVNNIDKKTIDPKIFLDYKVGIDEKVYKWIKSDDSKYYTLAYIDENGEPVKSAEAKINVGANNKESIDNGNMNNGGQGNRESKMQEERTVGTMPNGIPGGMMEMMMKNYEDLRGVYINYKY